ncbi:hypothetical protein LCGC14_1207320 [marine sediment metagenome]|uniref:Uncharacterized protein n=1 Tax=marine sediment metagenome TaxID=412755 RepID=A0A0F9M2G6_9ZZZZ
MPTTRLTKAAIKRADALKMRLTGASYREIAKAFGWAGPSGAHKAVDKALMEYVQEDADKLRRIDLARLDAMELSLAPKVLAGDTDAIRTRLKCMERRAKLTGIDEPLKVDIRAQLMAAAAEYGFTKEEAVAAAEDLIAGRA